jgi:hypothetical protein
MVDHAIVWAIIPPIDAPTMWAMSLALASRALQQRYRCKARLPK